MRAIAKLVLILAAGAFTVTAGGCVTAAAAGAAGAGVAYMMGDLKGTIDASPQNAADAAEAALRELGISVVSSVADDLEGTVTARTARDRRVRIELKRQSPQSSAISIRVGVWGDEVLSREIYDRIRANLPESEPIADEN